LNNRDNEVNIPASESYSKIFLRFLKFGFQAWGGPVAQIGMIRKELVDEEKWVSNERFNRALAVYQVLPGPEASELCVYFGVLAKGRIGGLLAGLGFMLPGFALMMLLTWVYVRFGINDPYLNAVFTGFHAAVIALITAAVHRIGKHSLYNKSLLVIAIISGVAQFFGVPFYIALPLAGIAYVLIEKQKTLLAAGVGLTLVAATIFLFDPPALNRNKTSNETNHVNETKPSTPLQMFVTGFKGGSLTFGGAYTVIPFIKEDAVEKHSWMNNKQFLDGIALSGILPAPLIIFSTFVGYFGAGWWGAILITIGIFLPAFAFTLIGHNLVEKVIQNKGLHNFLDGITAGVVGLIAVTAIQLFIMTIISWQTLSIFLISLIILYKWKSKMNTFGVIFLSGVLGFCFYII
jgi:chromate transporter